MKAFSVLIFAAWVYSATAAAASYGLISPKLDDDHTSTFYPGKTVTLEWEMPFPTVDVGIMPNPHGLLHLIERGNTKGKFVWPVDYNGTGIPAPLYSFWLVNSEDIGDPRNRISSQFRARLSVRGKAQETSIGPTATNVATTGSGPPHRVTPTSTGDSGAAASTSSATPSSSKSGKGGLSTGAKAGIGVGVAFGSLIVIILLARCFMDLRRRKQHALVPYDGAGAGGANDPRIVEQKYLGLESQVATPFSGSGGSSRFSPFGSRSGASKADAAGVAKYRVEADAGAERRPELDARHSAELVELPADERSTELPARQPNPRDSVMSPDEPRSDMV